MLRHLKKIRVVALLYGVFLGGYAGQAGAIPVIFNDLNPQIFSTITFTGDYAFEVTNNTGQTWTDFHFELGQLLVPPVIFGADPYTGPGAATLGQDANGRNTILDVIGLNIPSGQDYDLSLSMVTLEGAATLVGYPTVGAPGPSQVPGPATIALFGLGLIALPVLSRRGR